MSNNPLNTVKRVRIHILNIDIDLNDIIKDISDLLKSGDYNIQKIPKLYFGGAKEVVISLDNTSNGYLAYLKENDFCYNDFMHNCTYFFDKISIMNNTYDEMKIYEFLNIFLSLPRNVEDLTINISNKLGSHLISKAQITGIIDRIKNLYGVFKANHDVSIIQINVLKFYYDSNIPELQALYFSLLEIIIDMKIKIDSIDLIDFSYNDIIKFMDNLRLIKNNNIKNIHLRSFDINKDKIDSLDQYSYLFGGKIFVYFDENKEINDIKLIEICSLKNRKNFNKEFFLGKDYRIIGNTYYFDPDNKDCRKMLKISKSHFENNYLFKIISNLVIRIGNKRHFKYIRDLFTMFKKFRFIILTCKIEGNIIFHNFIDDKRNVYLMALETILDSKYREKLCERYFNINIIRKIDRKTSRYMRLHAIKNFLLET